MPVSMPVLASAADACPDPLSDVLGRTRFERATFFELSSGAPRETSRSSVRLEPARAMPSAGHAVAFLVVTSGTCNVALDGGERLSVERGDTLVFPHGDAHDLVRVDGGESHVVGAVVVGNTRLFEPLGASLPRVFRLRDPSRAWGAFESHLRLALAESADRRVGSECVLARLGELIVIESIRKYLTEVRPESAGWFRGLSDELVGRALAKLHERPRHEWSLEELGRKVGASRSLLAERFTLFVGIPPMQYLAQWRITIAASMLTDSSANLAEVADRVGYGSEAALSRAFKRVLGVPPSLYRQRRRAIEVPETIQLSRLREASSPGSSRSSRKNAARSFLPESPAFL